MTLKTNCRLIAGLLILAASAHAQTPAPVPAPPGAPDSAAPAPPAAPVTSDQAPAVPATAIPAPDAVPAPAATPPAAVATAPTPPASLPSLIPPPPAGKGEVVFFRPGAYVGWAVWFNVRENGQALGKLTNGAYFVKVTDPGPHTYTAATENHDVLKLEVDDGETYYVRGSVQMGVLVGEAALTPSDQPTFEKHFKHMKLAKPPEAAADKAPAAPDSAK
jgi:hypothetical protein